MKEHLTRLIKNTAIYGIGQVLTRAISFLLLPLFTTYLTPADYGIYGLLGMVSLFLVPVFSLGFGTSIGVCYFSSGGRETREATIWTAFTVLLLSTALLCTGGIFFGEEISVLAFQTDQYGYLVILTMLSTAFSVLVIPFMLYLQFEEMAVRFVVLASASTTISTGINVVMVVVLGRGIAGLVEGSLFGQIFNFFLFSFYPFKMTRFSFDSAISKDLLRNGLPMVPSFASLFVLQQGNRYILQWYHGLNSVGIYTVGYNIGMAMNVLVSAFTSAWVPFFLSFSEKKEEARILFGRILTYYLVGFGFLSLLFYIYARPIALVMTAPPFHGSYRVIGLTATSQLLIGVFSLLLAPVYFAKEVKAVSAVQLTSAGISVGIGILLIPRTGALGAAFVLMLGMLLMCLIQYLWNVVRKKYYLQILYESRRILGITVPYGFIAFLMLMDRNLVISVELIFSLVCTGFIGIFAYAALTAPEREEIKKYSQSLLFHK